MKHLSSPRGVAEAAPVRCRECIPLLQIYCRLSQIVFVLASSQVLVMLCFPLFSYAGVVGTASGMVDLKDMKPLLNMLRPSKRALMVSIRCTRFSEDPVLESSTPPCHRLNVATALLWRPHYCGDKARFE